MRNNIKCESCGRTKQVYELKGNFTWYQCWTCLELRAQEELRTDGDPFAARTEVYKRRRATIETHDGKRLGTKPEFKECPCEICSSQDLDT